LKILCFIIHKNIINPKNSPLLHLLSPNIFTSICQEANRIITNSPNLGCFIFNLKLSLHIPINLNILCCVAKRLATIQKTNSQKKINKNLEL